MGKPEPRFFRDAIADAGLSVRSVASRLGMMSHSQLSLTLSGKRRMQIEEAIGLSQILSVPLLDVIANAGFPEVVRRGVPVIAVLRGNGIVEAVQDNTERASAPGGLPMDACAVQARTPDTPLSWIDRWVFFCGSQVTPDDTIIGRFCLVFDTNDALHIGIVRRGYEQGYYGISGPSTAERIRIKWVRPVLMTRNA